MQDEPLLRTADQVELAMRRIAELQRQAAEERAVAIELVKSARLSDEEKAEIYWRFDVIPVSAMGMPQMITPIAARYPYWSWRCQVCGAEVFCTSRSDKADRERIARDKRKQLDRWYCHKPRDHVEWWYSHKGRGTEMTTRSPSWTLSLYVRAAIICQDKPVSASTATTEVIDGIAAKMSRYGDADIAGYDAATVREILLSSVKPSLTAPAAYAGK